MVRSPWPHPRPQPWNSLPPCFHFYISRVLGKGFFFFFWGGGRNAIGRLIKRVKTATAKWTRVDISPCQLWHGYLPGGHPEEGRDAGDGREKTRGEDSALFVPLPLCLQMQIAGGEAHDVNFLHPAALDYSPTLSLSPHFSIAVFPTLSPLRPLHLQSV